MNKIVQYTVNKSLHMIFFIIIILVVKLDIIIFIILLQYINVKKSCFKRSLPAQVKIRPVGRLEVKIKPFER